MISVRWRPTVFLDAVFKPFFKIVHDTGQQLTIDWTIFLTDGFLQIIQRTGFVSVSTRFWIPPMGWESEGATACLRNGKWGARETCFELRSLTHLQCALWHHLVDSTHWHRKRMPTTSSPPWPVYWVLPIQKMSGSRGSSCILAKLVIFLGLVNRRMSGDRQFDKILSGAIWNRSPSGLSASWIHPARTKALW